MVQISFKGKQFVQNHHLAVKYHELVPDKKASLTGKISLHDNLIIHGDNLAALKALLPTYAGKVKCIYIDPPYNTGNEGWVYNDNVNSPMMQEWLGKVVDKDDLTRHDKWLCMMWPRLRLLRELLAEDGVIFISIDDNEVHHLRDAMDEIFGEDNFLTTLTIRANPRGRQSDTNFATLHDFCVCYAKRKESIELNGLPLTDDDIADYDQEDKGGRKWRELGLRQRGAESLRENRPDMFFPIYVDPKSGKVSLQESKTYSIEVYPKKSDGREGRWSWGLKKVTDENDRVYARLVSGRNEYDIFIKDYLDKNDVQKTSKPKTIWIEKEVNTESGGKLLKLIMGDKVFDYPKPLGLFKKLLQIATDKDSIILDSFAGSGTTAHAVLALNKEDGGNRRFILVECEDYADTITAERVRRVIKGVKDAKDENLKNGLDGTFSYFELGKPIEMENILSGDSLPTYHDLARYIFFTATLEQLDERGIDESRSYLGESQNYQVFMFYKPDVTFLKNTALTLERAEQLGEYKGKRRLVFAPTKYLDQDFLNKYRIDFAQLPFEIYRLAK